MPVLVVQSPFLQMVSARNKASFCMHGVQEVRRAGAAPIPWQVPKLRRPAVCDQLEGENVKFFSIYENHPCRFLPA